MVAVFALSGVGPYAADRELWRSETARRLLPGRTGGPGELVDRFPAIYESLERIDSRDVGYETQNSLTGFNQIEAVVAQRRGASTMKRIVLVIAVMLPLVACGEDTPKKAEVRPVRVTSVRHTPSGETISLTGQIQARDQVNLAFRIGGLLRERNVGVGDAVLPGQIVAGIEPQDYQNALRSAEADLASAQAVLANAQSAENRQSVLLGKGIAARVTYDQAEQQLKTAQAQVESAQARLQNAKDNLAYTELKSDVAGSVTAKGAEPGEVVAAGRMVLQVATQGSRDAVFNVPSQLIRRSPKNPGVTVALSDDPSVVATGHVREVAPQADAATGTYVVKVALDNPPDAMRLGATIVGQIKLESEPVIALPGTALTQSEGKSAVWAVDPEKKTVSLRPITVGHYDTSSIIVTDGLSDGDLVVTAGVQALRPGQEVRFLETGTGDQK
jgi:RND family efflux transporter MFP subunit